MNESFSNLFFRKKSVSDGFLTIIYVFTVAAFYQQSYEKNSKKKNDDLSEGEEDSQRNIPSLYDKAYISLTSSATVTN